MKLELLKSDDLLVLLPGARSFFTEGAIPGKLNEEHFITFFRHLIDNQHGFVIGAFDESQSIVGAIGGSCFPDFATGDLTATEFFWYVLPESRMAGPRLLKAFEAESRRRGCVRLHMVHLANDSASKLDRFYERSGYRLLEKAFTKEL